MTEEHQPIPKKLSITLHPPLQLPLKSSSPISSFALLQPSPCLAPSSAPTLTPSPPIPLPEHHKAALKQFLEYSSTMDNLLEKANVNQLEELRNKYRFYLSKVEKLERVREMGQSKFQSLAEIVESSVPVMEEMKSIRFIKKVSEETEEKLKQVLTKVSKYKEQKKSYSARIEQLRQIIKREKDKFFSLKRIQMKISNAMIAERNRSKLENANNTFKTIVNEKISRKKEIIETAKELAGVSCHGGTGGESNYNCSYNGMEQSGDQKMKQISSRLSCFKNLQSKIFQNKPSSKDQELPQLNIARHCSQNEKAPQDSHYQLGRQSCQSDTYTPIIVDQGKNVERGRGKDGAEGRGRHFRWANEGEEGVEKRKMKVKKNQKIISQLNKIHIMKTQLLRQVEQLQNINPNTSSIAHTYTHSQQKQCLACTHIDHKTSQAKQKYSLHDEDIQKLRQKLYKENPNNLRNKNKKGQGSAQEEKLKLKQKEKGKENEWEDSLLAGQRTLKCIEEGRQARSKFMELGAEEIISRVVQAGKISQVLKLMEKDNINLNKSKTYTKMLR